MTNFTEGRDQGSGLRHGILIKVTEPPRNRPFGFLFQFLTGGWGGWAGVTESTLHRPWSLLVRSLPSTRKDGDFAHTQGIDRHFQRHTLPLGATEQRTENSRPPVQRERESEGWGDPSE